MNLFRSITLCFFIWAFVFSLETVMANEKDCDERLSWSSTRVVTPSGSPRSLLSTNLEEAKNTNAWKAEQTDDAHETEVLDPPYDVSSSYKEKQRKSIQSPRRSGDGQAQSFVSDNFSLSLLSNNGEAWGAGSYGCSPRAHERVRAGSFMNIAGSLKKDTATAKVSDLTDQEESNDYVLGDEGTSRAGQRKNSNASSVSYQDDDIFDLEL